MPLRTVELFCDIVAHRSFSKAAAARNLSQPAVSQALHHLEERLGAQLIDRSKRPFELTPAGHLYYERCSRLIDEFRAAADEVHSLGGRVTGRLRVVSIYSVGLLQMQEYINRYREQHPHVELSLDYAQPDEIYACVQRDEADLGIVSFPKDGGDIGCIPWVEQEMVLVVSPEHRLAEHTSAVLEQIEGESFIAFTADLTIRRATDRLLRKNRITVDVVHQFNNIENIKRAVEIGLGVSMLPLATVRRELDFGTLRAITLSDIHFHRPMGIVHKRHKHLSTAAQRFIDILLNRTASPAVDATTASDPPQSPDAPLIAASS